MTTAVFRSTSSAILCPQMPGTLHHFTVIGYPFGGSEQAGARGDGKSYPNIESAVGVAVEGQAGAPALGQALATGGAQHGWGLGVLPPATAFTSVSLGPGGPHPAAVSGVIWSGGATPITYASALFMITQSPAATLPMQSFPPMTITLQLPNLNPSGLVVCLSPGSEPVPQKLVDKVCSGAYVDMKELLGDNISCSVSWRV